MGATKGEAAYWHRVGTLAAKKHATRLAEQLHLGVTPAEIVAMLRAAGLPVVLENGWLRAAMKCAMHAAATQQQEEMETAGFWLRAWAMSPEGQTWTPHRSPPSNASTTTTEEAGDRSATTGEPATREP